MKAILSAVLVLYFFLVVPAMPVNAQIFDYYSGYVVTMDNDTIQGRIEARDNFVSPEDIKFTAASKMNTHTPSTIRAFYISELDLLFESHEVAVDLNSNTTYPTGEKAADFFEKGRFFLLTLVRSEEKSLYQLIDDRGIDHYYISTGGQLEQLIYHRQYVTRDGKKILYEKRRYRVQLLGYLIDCQSLKPEVDHTQYGNKPLKKLFLSYFRCSGNVPAYYRKDKSVNLNWGVVAGIGFKAGGKISIIDADSDKVARIGTSEIQKITAIELGFNINFSFNRNSRIAIINELKVKNQEIRSRWTRLIPAIHVVSIEDYTFNQTYLSLQTLLRVNIVDWSKGNIYMEGGYFAGLAVSADFIESRGVFLGDDRYRFTDEKANLMVRKTDIGLTGGVGMRYNRLWASVRYHSSFFDTQDNEVGVMIRTNVIALNVGYIVNW